MKKIRDLSKKIYVVVPLMMVFLLFSCSKSTNLKSPSEQLSGDDIFQAFYFGQGKATTVLPRHIGNVNLSASLSEDEKKAVALLKDDILKYINEKDPNFFAAFKSDIQSGDITRVKSALANSNKMLCDALNIDYNEFKKDFYTTEKYEKARDLLPDNFLNMSAEEKLVYLKKEEFKKGFRAVFPQKAGADNAIAQNVETYDTYISTETNTLTYFYVVAAAAAVIVVVIFALCEEPGSMLSAAADPGPCPDQLKAEETIANITEALKVG
uniref:Uncharacterized protein n=1 Tax=Sphingobacterium sp. (strain 21) TaxID=743722 RepID=F4C9S7_SPHS2